MTLFSDARWVGPHGIGRFAKEVLSALPATPVVVAGKPSDPVDCVRLALAMHRSGARASDAFFSPGYNAPLHCRAELFFTIHDLNHIDRPENASRMKSLYYEHVMRPACRRATRVLTVSEFSRQRIIEWSGVADDHVVNVGNGVDTAFNTAAAPWRPGYAYVLCVGNRKEHKNEARVLRAFARLEDGALKLVFTGESTPQLVALAASVGVTERVVFAGRVPEQALPGLYAGAAMLMFPSLYEGFGLPVVEAFACGVPVVTSATTSLPEIAGSAALLVDPLSESEITAAGNRILTEPTLRERLRQDGLVRARHFTWPRAVERTRQALASQRSTT